MYILWMPLLNMIWILSDDCHILWMAGVPKFGALEARPADAFEELLGVPTVTTPSGV